MSDLRRVQTARLTLTVPDLERDLEGLHLVFGEPGGATRRPERVHTDPDQTRELIERSVARWEADGIGSWTARLSDGGEVVGFGGAKRQPTRAWNIGYGLLASVRGRGLATELGTAAMEAADGVDATVPRIAWIRADNTLSIAVAERLGLIGRGLRIDPGDGQRRLAFSDRELSDTYGVPVASQENLR